MPRKTKKGERLMREIAQERLRQQQLIRERYPEVRQHPHKALIEREIANGTSVAEIAKRYEVPATSVEDYRREYFRKHPEVVARLSSEPSEMVDDSIPPLQFDEPTPDDEEVGENLELPEVKITEGWKIKFREHLHEQGISVPKDPDEFKRALHDFAKESLKRRRESAQGAGMTNDDFNAWWQSPAHIAAVQRERREEWLNEHRQIM